MKNLRVKVAIVILAPLFTTGGTYAQVNEKKLSVETLAERRVDKLDKSVDLSDAQKDGVYDIYLKYAKKMMIELKNKDLKPSKEGVTKTMKLQMKDVTAEIMPILNDAQKKKYVAQMKKR